MSHLISRSTTAVVLSRLGRTLRPSLLLAVSGALSLSAFSGCSSDDDDTTSSGAQGGSTAHGGSSGKGGAKGGTGGSGFGGEAGQNAQGGSSGRAGRGGGAGAAGKSGTGNAGSAGENAGESGTGGSTGGTGGSRGGTGGSTGGTTSGGEAGAGGETGQIIDPTSFDGKQVFRYDTFGDDVFWTETLRINEAIQAALDPTTALGLGFKVDAEAVPSGVLASADLTSPATTLALIGLDAVIGVKGTVDSQGNLTRVGITCALCHSNVDDSVMPGIGVRIDGQANRDLDPGAIIALSPGLAGNQAALDVLNSWGPGYYDPRWNQDGINHPVVIPSIYGLANVPLETYTGDGPISYWNSYVAVTQMHGQGVFFDPRIDVAVIYDKDLVTPKLPSLFEYEVSLMKPAVPSSAFDADAAARGATLFAGDAQCSTCHSGPTLTDAAVRLHAAAETGMDPITASRSATGLYRTTPLRGLLKNAPYFHDGSAATLAAVVTHYNTTLTLGLSSDEQADLVEYLKSL
jgi:hypothetical protein